MPPAQGDERARVAACARGDAAAFEAMLLRHAGDLRAGCARALALARGAARPDDLEEAEAEVRARLWRDQGNFFGGFRFACPLAAWLRLMAYRTALNWAQAESRRRHAALESGKDLGADPRAAEDDIEALHAALARLEPAERVLIEGACLEGLDHAELARRAGIAPGSVGPLLTRARRRLAEIVRKSS